MKFKKLLLVAVMVAMGIMAGCNREEKEPVGATVAVVEEITTEEETEEDTQEHYSVEETESETEEEKIGTGVSVAGFAQLFGKTNTESDSTLENADETTGYIDGNAETISESLQASGVDIEKLSQVNMDLYDGEEVLYRFIMENESSIEPIELNGEEIYMSQLLYDDEEFVVWFGNSSVTDYEEASVFCEKGTTMEYWAVGSVQDGTYVLLPIIAGNEAIGYYLVRPIWEMIGVDVSDTESLVEQGISFVAESKEKESNNTSVNITGEESIFFEITSVEDNGADLVINYRLTNSYPFNAYITDETITINGVDVTDSTTSYFHVDANDTIEDCFFIDGYSLKEGDELIIKGVLNDDDTLQEIGVIEFPFILERN